MVSDATQRFHACLSHLQNNPLTVIACDADAYVVQACHKNLIAAGLSPILDQVTLAQRALYRLPKLLSTLTCSKPLIITNPPYGERLGIPTLLNLYIMGLDCILPLPCGQFLPIQDKRLMPR